jgi:NAD(P)H-nitrite reductase large subunit
MKDKLIVEYLIIGNSAGGIGAAEAIREIDKTGPIAMISEEPYPAYSRPLISEYLAEERPMEKINFRPADFYEVNNIQVIAGNKVETLDIGEHTAVLADGSKIVWGKLLLATGGVPIVPPTPGIDKKGVFNFITLDDARAIDRFLNGADRVVVIGGGLIGVSVTEALVKRNASVTVVEMKDRLLSLILDEEVSAMAEKKLQQAGVEILTSHTVAKISSTSLNRNTVSSVVMDDGSIILCNAVVVAIGVRPRIELAQNSGISTNRGIVINRQMATSHPDIYACGDAAESYDFINGDYRLSPIWPNAYIGGRIAGLNMAGIHTEYQGGASMNSLNYFGLRIASAGIVNPPDNSYELLSESKNGNYRKVIIKDGVMVGMVLTGNTDNAGIYINLMRNKINVEGLKQTLVADDFNLTSLPEELWLPQLSLPSSAEKYSIISAEEPEEILAGE